MADYLLIVYGPLRKQVEEAMRDPSALGNYDLDLVMANLEILASLFERRLCDLPPPETIAEWKRGYLPAWEVEVEPMYPDPEDAKERREIIIGTFDRVERLAREGKGFPDIGSALVP